MAPEERGNLDKFKGPSRLFEVTFVPILGGVFIGAIAFLAVLLLGWITGLWSKDSLGHPILIAAAFFGVGWLYTLYVVMRSMPSKAGRVERQRDLSTGAVDEVIYEVSDAKGCRDPEHGILVYFILLRSGQVYVDAFTNEMPSDDDWLKHPERIPEHELPGRNLHLLFGSSSGNLLMARFSGARFTPNKVFMLNDKPETWPEVGSFVPVAWERIEKKYAERA